MRTKILLAIILVLAFAGFIYTKDPCYNRCDEKYTICKSSCYDLDSKKLKQQCFYVCLDRKNTCFDACDAGGDEIEQAPHDNRFPGDISD